MLKKDKLKNIDTVIMNPPFGAQKKGADRIFLDKALELGKIIYSIHNKGSYNFIKQYIYPSEIIDAFEYKFPIYKSFSYHKKEVEYINIEIYKIKNNLI